MKIVFCHLTSWPSVFFQDVLDSKNSAIKDLQYELARVCKVSTTFLITLLRSVASESLLCFNMYHRLLMGLPLLVF